MKKIAFKLGALVLAFTAFAVVDRLSCVAATKAKIVKIQEDAACNTPTSAPPPKWLGLSAYTRPKALQKK